MALFKFGKKTTAHVLPTLVAALLGAEEGKELVVEASEDGIAAIAAAEEQLAAVREHVAELEENAAQAAVDAATVKEYAATIATLSAEKASLEARVEELGKKPATNHTTVVKKTDALENDNRPKGLLDDEIAEAAAELQARNERMERARKIGILK